MTSLNTKLKKKKLKNAYCIHPSSSLLLLLLSISCSSLLIVVKAQEELQPPENLASIDDFIDDDDTLNATNTNPDLPDPSTLTPLEQPPENLAQICQESLLNDSNAYAQCEMVCSKAKCCNLPEEVTGSCLRGHLYDCLQYHRECSVLDSNIGYEMPSAQVNLEPASVSLPDWCSAEGLANPDTQQLCQNQCTKGNCCWSLNLEQGQSCRDNANCPSYAPCLALQAQNTVTSNGEIAKDVNTKCSSDNLASADGLAACKQVCEAQRCCWDPNFGEACTAIDANACDQYSACGVALVNQGLDDDGMTDDSGAYVDDPMNLQTDTQLAAPPDNLASICNETVLASDSNALEECKAVCSKAACCSLPGAVSGSCLNGNLNGCLLYHSQCSVLDENIGYQQPSADVNLEPASSYITEWCVGSQKNVDAIHALCVQECGKAACCWSLDLQSGQSCRDNPQCPGYAACLALQANNVVNSQITSDVEQKCSSDSIQTTEGMAACQQVCMDHKCCWDPQSTSECYYAADNCDQYSACKNALVVLNNNNNGGINPSFNNCAIDEYYASLFSSTPNRSHWTRAQLSRLLTSTHRAVLPIQEEDKDDVYEAIIDLYPGTDPGVNPNETVQLAFQDVSYEKEPYGNVVTWTRCNLWPEERMSNLTKSNGSKTDIHANVCAPSSVVLEKGILFFGECGLFTDPSTCQPLPETDKTWTDGKIWQSPVSERGRHARQILYMATRYYKEGEELLATTNASGTNNNNNMNESYSLELFDCPPFPTQNVFGYLSVLLEWHQLYNVTDAERQRNNRICERWQGNRNPFVDYPDLAEQLFGVPDSIKQAAPGENKTYHAYSKCFPPPSNDTSNPADDVFNIGTDAPTHTPNPCQDIEPGDIQIILTNSEDSNQIAFFTLANIPSGVDRIYVTDRPWDGTSLLDNGEGVVSFQVPDNTTDNRGRPCDGLCPGYLFAYNFPVNNVDWSNDTLMNDQGDFDLGITGDTILTYCLNAEGYLHFIHGFSYSPDGWADPGLSAEEYGMDKSALPDKLTSTGSVAVAFFQNNIYNGTTTLSRDQLLLDFAQPSNYKGSNEVRFSIDEFQTPPSTSAATTTMPIKTIFGHIALVVSSLVVVTGMLP